ncbi:hypothetical protein IIC44_00200 [Patescibacteria group bacterium]|nr:hypothetical protein [Patescibacteria group bacterium]MCH8048512.1 hypothetical protein [Patescibacteria group bacterium]
MAISFVQKKKIQHLLVPILGAVIFITTAVIWWGFFTTNNFAQQGILVPASRVQINTSILFDPLLEKLDKPRAKTQIPSTVGRENPLLPFVQ